MFSKFIIFYISLLSLLLDKIKSQENTPFVLFDSGSPPTQFGTDGFDIDNEQSIATRFISNIDANLDQIGVWMMSNDVNATNVQPVEVSLVQGNRTHPIGNTLFNCTLEIHGIGWNPEFFVCNNTLDVALSVDNFYWIVLESNSPSQANPVCLMTNTVAFSSNKNAFGKSLRSLSEATHPKRFLNFYENENRNATWSEGGVGAAVGAKVIGSNNPLMQKKKNRTEHKYLS